MTQAVNAKEGEFLGHSQTLSMFYLDLLFVTTLGQEKHFLCFLRLLEINKRGAAEV